MADQIKGDLNESNYREFAKEIVARYGKQGMIIDAMLWGRIVGYYEQALQKAVPVGAHEIRVNQHDPDVDHECD